MIKVGSLFSGIGGFEIGFEAAFGHHAKTVWQVEKEPFCQQILKQHFPESVIYDDVRTVGSHNLEPVDVVMGGFPCQSISLAGRMEGLQNEEKSGLWWEMFRIISELRPRIVLLENVANVLRVGGTDVIGSLAGIGYSCEWTVIRASDFGAPHRRARWFCVAYPVGVRREKSKNKPVRSKIRGKRLHNEPTSGYIRSVVSNPNMSRNQTKPRIGEPMGQVGKTQIREYARNKSLSSPKDNKGTSDWTRCQVEPMLLGMDDGVSNWMDRDTKREHNKRMQALGNAIVPQCAEWVAMQVLKSGLLDHLMEES